VIGDGATVAVLAAVTELAWEPLVEALETSVRAGMLREEPSGYDFTHALIRQTLLDELSLPRRQRLHLQVAAALERVHAGNLAPHVAALAYHYRLSGALAPSEQVVAYARQAAEAVSAVFAWEDAVGHLQTALAQLVAHGLGETDQSCDVLLALGEAQRKAGD